MSDFSFIFQKLTTEDTPHFDLGVKAELENGTTINDTLISAEESAHKLSELIAKRCYRLPEAKVTDVTNEYDGVDTSRLVVSGVKSIDIYHKSAVDSEKWRFYRETENAGEEIIAWVASEEAASDRSMLSTGQLRTSDFSVGSPSQGDRFKMTWNDNADEYSEGEILAVFGPIVLYKVEISHIRWGGLPSPITLTLTQII